MIQTAAAVTEVVMMVMRKREWMDEDSSIVVTIFLFPVIV